MEHNWLNMMTWSQARSYLRDQIIHDFQATQSRVVYEDLSDKTGIPPYAMDVMLCQNAALDYKLGRARTDTPVTRRNKLMPEDGYFNFRLNLKRLLPGQDWEEFYEMELALCCKEFGVELRPGCLQLELWDGSVPKLIPLKEMEKRRPDMLKNLRHSGKHYREALPPKSKIAKRKPERKKFKARKDRTA